MSFGPTNQPAVAGRVPHRTSRRRYHLAQRLFALPRVTALLLALVLSATLVTPALGADVHTPEASPSAMPSDDGAPARASLPMRWSGTAPDPFVVAEDDERRYADDGGFLPMSSQVVIPSTEIGLSPQRAIPLGVTCSCTIDRVGLTSQFDITVIEVVQDAYTMVQQLNRFNHPPRPGHRYVAAYVGQQYIAGPESQAYTTSEADWKGMATDYRLSDTAQLLRSPIEYRPRAEVFPRNYVNGWLIYELPLDRPAFLVWSYNFVGERGVWFALQ